ncbi:MAG: aryl-alcohol dehydrogenase-like predicted oxidoreductase [Oceanospirillaceae bacterium]|jgi:aryl-alcohol dehydrogenase-like predicted oxidoreductase
MKHVKLGQQGLMVPAVGLGCMGMSEFYGPHNQEDNLSVLSRAIELGCTFWDTADMYGPFTNETLLGKALVAQRDKVTLATKFGISRNQQGDWLGVNGRPDYVKASCEASLQRLNTDYIDVYYQHRIDPNVPIEETVGAMAELVKEGKVRYLGLSEAEPEQIRRAHRTHPISVLQTEYSLWSRDIEENILPTTRELGIGFVAYSPMGRGFLSGGIHNRSDLQSDDWRLDNPRFQQEAIEKNRGLVNEINKISIHKGVSSAQLSLAWLLAQGRDIAMIPGTKHLSYLEQNWQSMEIQFSKDELIALDQLSDRYTVIGSRY